MRIILAKTSAILAVAAFCNFAPAPAWSFSCQSGTIGQGNCSCSGTADCTDMRHSKMCKTDLSCSQGKCTCTAALVDPGTTTTGGGRPKLTLPKGAVQTLQKAP